MAKKNKKKSSDSPATPAGAVSAPSAAAGGDLVVTAERVFERGDFSTTRKLIPKLRAEDTAAAKREADKLWERVKVDPIELGIGFAAAAIALAVAAFTLHG